MKQKLTQLTVDSIAPKPGRRIDIWDQTLLGFGVRIAAKTKGNVDGTKTYFLMTRTGIGAARRQQRFKIGRASTMDLAEARAKARDILRRIDEGEDPAPRGTPAPDIFGAFVVDSLARAKPNLRPSTYCEYERLLLSNAVPRWGNLQVAAIRQRHVMDLLDAMVQRGAAVSANRMLAVLWTLFKDAVKRGLITSSPAAALERPTRQRARERALSDEELSWFWQAAESVGGMFGAFFKFQTLTGQRHETVRLATWDEVDLENRTWTIAGAKMKAGREHQVALGDLAIEVLAEIKAAADRRGRARHGGLVFTLNGERPLVGFSDAKERLDTAMERLARRARGLPLDDAAPKLIPAWRMHDMRRTLVHGLAQLGIAPHICDKILAHSTGAISGVAAIYNKYAYLDERRNALVAWDSKIAQLIGRVGADNVHRLRG
jgi:integrase